MDKGREVFRQADIFLEIAAQNGVVPETKDPKEVRGYRVHHRGMCSLREDLKDVFSFYFSLCL